MLSGEGNENCEKTTTGLISKNATLHVPQTFFVHFFAVVLHDYNVKLQKFLSYTFFWRKCRTCRSFTFFHCRSFSPCISHVVTAATKFSCCSFNKKSLLCFFFISRSKSLSPFLSLSFVGLPPTFSFSLSFSCSTFQICGHDYQSKLNTLDNKDTETIPLFVFIYSLVVTRVAMGFPAKITSSCIWVATLVD